MLRYVWQAKDVRDEVRPILVVERAPSDLGWIDLCIAHGVQLVWGDTPDGLREQLFAAGLVSKDAAQAIPA